MGGFFTALVIFLWISIFLGCLSDFWFDNIFQTRSFALRKTPYKTRRTTIKASVLLYNVLDINTCYAGFSSTGYDGNTTLTCSIRPESGCHCQWVCQGCLFSTQSNNQQLLKLTLNNTNAFTSMVGYQYDVETFFNDQLEGNDIESKKQFFSLNGTLKAPANNVFFGSDTPNEVNFNIYDANYFYVIGGNLGGPIIQLFNMFASITKWTTVGFVTELTGKFKNAPSTSLPVVLNGTTAGVSLLFRSQFLPQIYTVDENLKQNGLEFVAEILAWLVGLYFIFEFILVFYEWFSVWAPQKWEDFFTGPYTSTVRQVFTYFDEDIFQKHFTAQFSWVRETIFKVQEVDDHEIVEEAKKKLGEDENKKDDEDLIDINEPSPRDHQETKEKLEALETETKELKDELSKLKESTTYLEKELSLLQLKLKNDEERERQSLSTKLEEIIDIDKIE